MLHPLKNTWTLYLHLPNETDWSINSYKNINNSICRTTY